ncbi:MAG: histidine kinase dimerization/phospho-acceptor domain-containing protein [Stenomitos frigidus ULC029]
MELQHSRRDGTVAWMLARGEAIRNAVGVVVKLAGTSLDITERKHLETEQQRLSQLKDDFLNTASHELRTPLASIKMAVHMIYITVSQCAPSLLETHPTQAEHLSRYLAILETQSERELQLVNDLLAMQRLEAGQSVPEWQPVNLLDRLAPLLEVYQE